MLNKHEFRIALARKNLSAIAVAHEIGVHHTTLSRWVRGWYPIPEEYQSKIAKVLEIKIHDLFTEDKER